MIYKEKFPVIKALVIDQFISKKPVEVELFMNSNGDGYFYSNGKVFASDYDYYAGVTIRELELIELYIN